MPLNEERSLGPLGAALGASAGLSPQPFLLGMHRGWGQGLIQPWVCGTREVPGAGGSWRLPCAVLRSPEHRL